MLEGDIITIESLSVLTIGQTQSIILPSESCIQGEAFACGLDPSCKAA